MSSHGDLLSVCSKNFVKFCVVLSNICIWAWLYVSSGSLQRWSSYVFRVFMLHLWGFLSKKSPPKSRVIVVCSGLERIGKSLKIRKNGWLCEALESWEFLHSQPSLAHDKWDIFWLTSFESCIRALCGLHFTRKWYIMKFPFLLLLFLKIILQKFCY